MKKWLWALGAGSIVVAVMLITAVYLVNRPVMYAAYFNNDFEVLKWAYTHVNEAIIQGMMIMAGAWTFIALWWSRQFKVAPIN